MRRRRKSKLSWGQTKKKTKPYSDNPDDILRFRCDKYCEEAEERIRKAVKVYACDNYSQEFLKTLVSPKSL